ncbi:MAG: pyruvate, water dikinase regulatory protein [Prolixibacteraceae bacterium]|jgi:regulator of PEP synthase PpsR (kinase-PPPase family)|nr:pyruvate, water dikinase regulatory protein [Prolixibacteraceae bacterium]
MDRKKGKKPPPIYVVSGGKGLAGNNMVQSLLIQYPNNNIPVVIVPDIGTVEGIEAIILKAKADGGLVTHTMVNPELRDKFNELGVLHQVKVIDFMGDLARYLDQHLDIEPLKHPGLYREINAEYFDRIEAIEFTLNHDDGLKPERLHQAEIILTGVSRSGKTPLSVYLAMYGWKVANVPIVKGIPVPKELFEVDPKRVFGLNISIPNLIAHRIKRMRSFNMSTETEYTSEQYVKEEIRNALFVFQRGNFTILNVTNKPIESTANEILHIMTERFEYGGRKLKSPYRDKESAE